MKQKKHIAMVGAVFCTLLLALPLSVTPTQSRYENAVSWKGVYAPVKTELQSNYLRQGGINVLLQPWKITEGAARTEEVFLSVTKGVATGTLSCTTDSPYITATVSQENIEMTSGGYAVTLRLSGTSAATGLQNAETAVIRVTFNSDSGELSADFVITLLPAQTTPEQPEEGLSSQLTIEPNTPGDLGFAWTEKLCLTLTAEGDADQAELMFNGDKFPEGTKFCINEETWQILADPMMISFPVKPNEPQSIVLDFSGTEVTPPQTAVLTATAYKGTAITGEESLQLSARREPLGLGTRGIAPVIAGNGSLQIPMTGDMQGLGWQLERLVKTEDTPVYITCDDVTVEIQNDENQGLMLTLSNTDFRASAGTYRLTLTRSHDGVVISTCQLSFFIHY